MSYFEKYQKYKNKYLALKQMIVESGLGDDIVGNIDQINATETSVNTKSKNNIIQGLFNNVVVSESDSLSDLGRLTDSDEIVQEGGNDDSHSESDSPLKSSDSDDLDISEDSV